MKKLKPEHVRTYTSSISSIIPHSTIFLKIIFKMYKKIEQVKKMRDIELKKGVFDEMSSFHSDFYGCPWIVVKNLNYLLSEGDICTVFEQFGVIVNMELIRDKKTGVSTGTCFICYEDWRSTILSVDNFNGITLLGRNISVDHINYKENPTSQLTDPRKLTPARLQTKSNIEIKDDGSASETETDTESS